MALRAQPEKIEPMGHRFESARLGDSLLHFLHEAFVQLDSLLAPGAHQMVVMSIVTLSQQLKAGTSRPEFHTFHHSHLLQQLHRSIDGHEIAVDRSDEGVNILNPEGTRIVAHRLQNRLSRPGDPP